MKKLLAIFVAILFASCFLTSCGSEDGPGTVTPERINITGGLSEYLEVVDNEYEISYYFGGNLSIKVRALKTISKEELENMEFNLTATILKDDGMPISGASAFQLDYNSQTNLINLLKHGHGEEILLFTSMLGDGFRQEHISDSKMFTISSSMNKKETPTTAEYNYDSPDSSDEVYDEFEETYGRNENRSKIEDWDAVLDSYEQLINKYDSLLRKLKNNDNSAYDEWAEVVEQSSIFTEKLENADDDLTSEQMNKFVRLQTKLTKVIAKYQ